jgi:putative addiction module component (TIGR02574 family)
VLDEWIQRAALLNGRSRNGGGDRSNLLCKPPVSGNLPALSESGRIVIDDGRSRNSFLFEMPFINPAQTLQAVREWPVDDKLELVFGVWDQLIDDGWRPQPNDELAAELDRRIAAHEANPTDVRTWEQVLERVRRRQ